jgi:hypothetical protein
MSAPPRRSLRELTEVSDPAWPELQRRIVGAINNVVLLPADPERGKRSVEGVQAPVSTVLGAIALHVGGLLVDDGWLRVLGCGHPRMRAGLLEWNGLAGPGSFPGIGGAVIVAHDVLGGVFAVNGGGLFGALGELNYWDPREAAWAPLEVKFPSFIVWVLEGDLQQLYSGSRWDDWDRDVGALTGDQAMVRTPPPWSPAAEAGEVQVEVRPIMPLVAGRWRGVAPAVSGLEA